MVQKAIDFATKVHEGQYRKGTDRPYIVHPMEVGKIVSTMTQDEEIISAAILHDTIEDCEGVDAIVLKEMFSARVARIVSQESEDKSKTWMERKSATIERLKTAPIEVQMIGLADKLSNMRDIDRDYPVCGEELWNRFRMKDKATIGWYYKGVREALREAGEYVAIMGESGSGKTTLLNILAALDKPTGGKVYLKGNDLGKIREKEMAAFRRQNLGFVFQDFNLLDTLTLKDNIFLPLVLSGKKYTEMESRIAPIAEQLGISKLLNKYPYEVSGGQKQRAAIARALISQPQLILADEPSGALDSRSTDELLGLFNAINDNGQTIVMVTHSVKAASTAKRVLFIKDGEVFHQLYRGNLTSDEMYQKITDTLTVLTTGGEHRE